MDESRMPIAMSELRKKKVPIAIRLIALIAILFIGMEVATVYFASKLYYHQDLGDSFYNLYMPWKIFEWFARYGDQIPMFFTEAGIAGTFTVAILLGIMSIIIMHDKGSDLERSGNEVMHGSARWATEDDIRRAGLFSKEGVYVGGWEDKNGRLHYLRHNGSEHLLCMAPTRSGKGICLVIPTLLSWTQSCVITDLKGELWALTAGWRQKYANNKVLLFEPASNKGSIKWNPMEEIRIHTENEIGDTQNLATMIVDPDGKGLNDHWQKTSQALLVGCILHLLYKQLNGDCTEASLPAVDAMLADPTKKTSDLWQEMISYKHIRGEWIPVLDENKNKIFDKYGNEKQEFIPFDKSKWTCHPAVAKAAQDMIDRPEQEGGSVLSTAKSFLSLFRDPVVAKNCRHSEFKMAHLMDYDTPVSLYIVTQPSDKARLRPFVRILVNMICRILAVKMTFEKSAGGGRRGVSKHEHKLLMMLDEFPSLGKLDIVQESLAFLAGYKIRFYIICQDITQLKSKEIGYGDDEAISSNCHIQNAFQPNRIETAKHLSELTGTTTVMKEQYTISGDNGFSIKKNISRSMQEVSRPLMTPDECLRMTPPEKEGDRMIKGGGMLIYVAGFPAIYGRQMPYFLDPIFNKRSSVDPPDTTDLLEDAKPEYDHMKGTDDSTTTKEDQMQKEVPNEDEDDIEMEEVSNE